jgi:hypothetical protein
MAADASENEITLRKKCDFDATRVASLNERPPVPEGTSSRKEPGDNFQITTEPAALPNFPGIHVEN